jgi:hypothetical protein
MKWSVPALILVFIIFLLFFPAQLRPELVLRPVWTMDITGAPLHEREQAQAAVPFNTSGFFGYVTLDGKMLLKEKKLFGLAIDSERYINFSSVPGNLVVRDNRGRVTDSIEVNRYPMLLDGRFLLISTNRAGIAEFVAGETPLWQREYTSVITDLDARGGLLAIGLLDSRVQVLDESGATTLELDLKGSRINAVYGCALPDDGRRVAVIHGIDPQYLSIVDMTGGGAEITGHRLEEEYRTTRYLRFFDFDRYLLAEKKDGVMILDLDDNTEYDIHSAGAFAGAGVIKADNQINNLIWFVAGSDEISELVMVDPPGRVLFRSILSSGAEVFQAEDQLLLGIGEHLCALKKEVR